MTSNDGPVGYVTSAAEGGLAAVIQDLRMGRVSWIAEAGPV